MYDIIGEFGVMDKGYIYVVSLAMLFTTAE